MSLIKKSVDQWLNGIDYSIDVNYVPSEFSLNFINFIKLITEGKGEEQESPVIHYHMLDKIPGKESNIINMCSRGMAKTAIFGEILFLYIAVFGGIDDFGSIDYALYVGDSIENNVKKMRKRIENRWNNSPFLQRYIPEIRFTDIRWYFKNKSGKEFVVTGHGAQTGVRGTVELSTRPQLAILDDLISDNDARSPTVIASVEDTIFKAVRQALHPKKRKVIWSGTPFNAKDPLYKAVESGAWSVNIYPVCEKFPCTRQEFKGAWEERFNYDFVRSEYEFALENGKLASFNQELMLRIMSEEDRLIQDSDIVWYKRNNVLNNKGMFNFYITTDFATSSRSGSDFSFISVWAYNSNGDYLWVDGVCKKQLMDENINDLFRLAQMYKPQGVGIEVTGQQGGFIPWIQDQMMVRNNYFTLVSEGNNNKPGIRPINNKISRFHTVVPWFKSHKIWLPEEMREHECMIEMLDELSLVTREEFKSKHDDALDTISMLTVMKAWKPSVDSPKPDDNKNELWEDVEVRTPDKLDSYII